MRARSTRLAASVRERAIDVSLANSSSPSDSSIARRHATMTFHLLARIKSHFTNLRSSDESHPTDRFLGIDELERLLSPLIAVSPPIGSEQADDPGFDPDSVDDERERAIRAIRLRRGQPS